MSRNQAANQHLSIINPDPKLIEGPDLLHHLVASPSTSTAIDFLENGSKRRKFSYKTLHALSDGLAQKICEILEKLEYASSIIPVLLPQSPELYVVLLAILKAGKAFCPLSLDTPAERIDFILNDISADLLIANSSCGSNLPTKSDIVTLYVDQESFQDEENCSKALPNVNTGDVAYVLYTSGSTGMPKAVSVSHRAATQSLLAHDRHIPHFTRFLQFAAPTFDVSIFEIFFPWYRGCTVTSRTRVQMLDDLSGSIRVLDADAAELTPTVVSNLLDGRSSVPNLRLLLTIGEMLTRDVVEEYGSSDSKEGILWAMYGPTEAAIHCTLQPRISTNASTQMIGFPLDTVSAFVALPASEVPIPTLSILPIGEEGELVVGGHQIADGYLNRTELTSASFMHHPQYGPLYRTGDRARLRNDGTIECLGRVVNGQVKLRGQRVELGEIEHAIMKTKGCRAAVAMVVDEALIAFCAIGSCKVSRADVLQTCKQWLLSIMIPHDVVLVHRMPQLPSGKIDRSALITMHRHALHHYQSKLSNLYSDAGHTVLDTLKVQLKHDVAPESMCADAGLDSLQAIRLASALRAKGYQITALQLLAANTIDEILQIAHLDQSDSTVLASRKITSTAYTLQDLPELKPWHSAIDCVLPCTPLQEAMLAETMSRSSAYCNWAEVELSRKYTFEEIQTALQVLAQGNEILRSGFYPTTVRKATFVQVVFREVTNSHVQQVSAFSRPYSLGSRESLLRPLVVQVMTHLVKPRLLFQMHHAIYDGWSLDLIIQDLGMLLEGKHIDARPQFREIVQFHDDYSGASQILDEQYWVELLRDRTDTSLPNFNGQIVEDIATHYLAHRSTVEPKTLLERSQKLNISPQVFFQTALSYMMSLYTGSSDIVIGNVASGRTIPVTGVEQIVGPCIATLPFRLQFEDLPMVRDILGKTHQQNRKSLEHCSFPLRSIAKAANVRAGARMFDVLFVWQQSMQPNHDHPSPAVIVNGADELEFKITLEFEPHHDHIACRATYDNTVFPNTQVQQLCQQIDQVVTHFLHNFDSMTKDIAECFSKEVGSIANSLPQQRPPRHSPSAAVERWASKIPDTPALCFYHRIDGKMHLKAAETYSSLNSRANQLARVFSSHGVRTGDLIAVIMEKSANLYITILAVLKLGAGYLPLVPDLPEERIWTILDEAQTAICIGDASTPSHVRRRTSMTFVCLDKIDLAKYANTDIGTPHSGTNIAYAVFTSGSTGSPKGVLVTQDNLMSNLDYLSTIYPYSRGSRLLQACSQAFDVSVFEIFFSWHVGICLCTAKKDDLFFDLEGSISQLDVTHLSLTPTVAALIDPDNVPQVEFLVTAGEAVTEHVRRKWAGRGLYQGYGPSETTNICTVRTSVSPSDLINNIGKPFDNTSAFVLDPQSDRVLPRGAVGELCFGGYQVFRGYLNQPDLTAAKIIQHPTYGRLYRSGDVGTLLDDDSILFAGRLDDQVKVRGQRVELGEISSIVLDQPCARDCATLLVQPSQGAKALVTFCVPATATDATFRILNVQDHRSDATTILTALSQRLPSYMVPSHVLPVSRLPTTPQGKIDKRRLQECFNGLATEDLTSADLTNDAVVEETTDLTPWELQVSQVLSEQFGLSMKSIRRSSSFFSIGLDSVSAIQFSNRLRKANLGNFTISDILKNPTISRLALVRDSQKTSHELPETSKFSLEEAIALNEVSRIRTLYEERGTRISKIRPCTPLQEAMLSTARSSTESSYSNVMVFSVNGDSSRLQQCWTLMMERHEILRTAFVATDDPSYAFVQVVLEDVIIQWGDAEWSSGTQQLANRVISDLLQANKPPVWLALDRSEPTPKMLFCCHHAIYDGIATQTLLGEVQELYHHHDVLPPISFDLYLQQMLTQDLAAADEFWEATFRDFEPTAFPDLTSQVARTSPISASHRLQLQFPLSEVRKACQNMSVTLLSVMHATWAKLLHFYTGDSDVCFGTVVSGRSLPGQGLERLIAPCFNTLPVRINFDFGKENRALALQAHSFSVDSSAFHLTPLRRIQKSVLNDGGSLFDTLVILQHPHQPLDDTIWTLEYDLGDMDLPVVCEISQDDVEDKLDLVIHYHTTVMSGREAEVIAKTFDTNLKTIVTRPHRPANDTVNILSSINCESEFSIMPSQYKRYLLHEDFENNAQTDPCRIALDFMHADGSRTTWSYRMLDVKANGIARALLQHSVEPEDIVPVLLAKGPDFYASILGILKAGVAFAPVHPELPEARRRLMIDDLKAKVVIYDGCTSIPELQPDVRLLDVRSLESVREAVVPQVKGLNNSNLAYCIFTSGSTGMPKAVSVEHRAPVQTIECSKSIVPWSISSRLLQYAATTFDMCYYDCFLAWSLGITLCAAEQDIMLNDLPNIINALAVDLLDLTPSVAISLVKSEVPCVKWLYCIGEAMAPSIVKEWEGACVNSYGPSEAAFCTSIFPVSKDIRPSVIGKPFKGTSFEVFSALGARPLPLLSVGELYIGGGQLARGYHNRSQLTKEKFVAKSGQRLYRTGDIVRKLVDGNFEFIGRADDQVKIRGLRVELGEINTILRESHTAIVTAVTQILKKDAASKEQLVAFLVMRPENDDGDEELSRQLRQAMKLRLPSYMVPQFFIFVDRIPRSLANKVDKNALASIFRNLPNVSALPNGTLQEEPRHLWNSLEDKIRHVFAHLSSSSVKAVSPTTTIYQLGLDSISAVQIAAALRREGYGVNASDVMRHLTCADLAAHIERATLTEQTVTKNFEFGAFEKKYRPQVLASCNIEDQGVAAVRPCTPLQRGMLSQMLAKEGTVYINYIRLKLGPDVNLTGLKQAWAKVMAYHQILRTGFAHLEDKDHPFGMIEYTTRAATLPWTVVANHELIETPELWLGNLQRVATSKLHVPLWSIRITRDQDVNYCDLAIFHALFDAQSLQSILRDVAVAYRGQELRTPTNIDLVVDGILQRSTTPNEQAKVFWTQMGEHAAPSRFPNLAPLRYDPEPPSICTHQSGMSLKNMETACRHLNTTLQAACLASWLSLISAYVGEPTATCGVVLSGRSFEAAEDVVFPCINTVPFAHTVTADLKEMVASITVKLAEMQQYQHTPLTDIQRMMGSPSEALFDTIFAFQKLHSDGTDPLPWSIVDEKATIEYPLSIELEPSGEYLNYQLTFSPHTIPQEQASLILRQLDQILQCFMSTPTDNPIFDKSLYSITPAKEATLSSDARFLHDFVEATASEYPQRIAFEFAHSICAGTHSAKSWTYAELDAEGNRIAHLLISNGVRPGDLVGVCFDKCPEASFAMLGVLKAGAAFVAIDPGAPPARQVFIVQDSGATAILSMSAQSDGFARDVKVPVLNLTKSETGSFPSTKPKLERSLSPQDRSYCLYTSGTTGTPKGCELTHENAVQALLSFQRLFAGHWTSESRWLQFASFHFDVSVLEQYWSWSVGICVVSAPRDVIFEDLANSISTLGITHIDLTPSLAQILHPDDVQSLCKGVFITGGESLKQEILDVWGPKGVIYNGYGPTEATIGCTMYPRVPTNGKPSNIGPQFDNVGTFVFRPGTDEPVLRGGIGELCVSGKLVGKGYLNRDDLTRKSFPYLERFGERVYRTGDLVRILHDGTFEFLGRADDQVKLRGQRLEIGEINSVIRKANNNVSDVATLVLKHPRQQKEQLVSFVVQGRTQGHPAILLEAVNESSIAKDACHDKLPPYMVPTHFVPLSSLPLNVNNKADVKKLKNMYETLSVGELQQLSATSRERERSWSSLETNLRNVFKKELDVEEDAIGKDTNFFELGMDSISVIGVVRALKKAKIAGVSASLVMKYSTIHRLAKALSTSGASTSDRASLLAAQQAITAMQHRHRSTVARSLSVNSSDMEALAPCTPLQQGMIARSLESEARLYFNTFQFKLGEDVEVSRLKAAWETVFASTEILRTIFADTTDGFMQVVLRNLQLPWTEEKVAEGESLEDYIKGLKKKWLQANSNEFTRPLELVLLTAPTKKRLVVQIFHGLYDGVSLEIVFKAVRDAYHGNELGQVSPSFHSALAHGPLRVLGGAKTFWQDHLSGDIAQSPMQSSDASGSKAIHISRQLQDLQGFDSARRTLNVTAQAIAQACWVSILQEHLKATTTIGVVVSGRSIDLEGADGIIGPMFNTIPYQHRTQKSESWSSIIKRVHDFNVAAHSYQHTSLRDINKWCNINRDQPLFDTLFVYQAAQSEERWTDNEFMQFIDGGVNTDYPLSFEVEQRPNGGWRLTLVAQSHAVDEATCNKLLDRFEEVLYEAIEKPAAHVETSVELEAILRNKPEEQQHAGDSFENMTGFTWTDDADTVRMALSELTNTELTDINESTSIFELGLDSIDAIKLSSKLKRCGLNLPVSGIMRGLTISKMLPNISKTTDEAAARSDDSNFQSCKRELRTYIERQGINTNHIEDVLPSTPLQEAMIAEMIASEFSRYYNSDVMKLQNGIDIGRLRNAWIRVVEASPILRTSFVEIEDSTIDGSFAQVVYTTNTGFWKTIKLSGEPDFASLFEEVRDQAMRTTIAKPPFQILLVESQEQNYLVLSIAHALYDGWSLGLLHSDVKNAYGGNLEPRPSYQPAIANVLATSGADATTFWSDYLDGAQPSTFDRRSQVAESKSRGIHRIEHHSEIDLAGIIEFAKKSNVSLQTLGQSVFAIVLASYVHSLDVTFGSVLSGRDDQSTSKLLFPTMNTVAIRTILHGTRLELLRHVQESFSNIKQWQHFPLRKALAQAGANGGLFESLFIYQRSMESGKDSDRKLYASIEGHSDVEYPVCVEVEVVSGRLVWRCAVKNEVFDEVGANGLLARLNEVLGKMMAGPDESVIDFAPEGTSLCGLPPFEVQEPSQMASHSSIPESQNHPDKEVRLEIVRTIRQILARVSETPEDEITDGMTIFHIGLDSISAIKVSSSLRKQNITLSVGEMLRAGSVKNMARIAEDRSDKATDREEDHSLVIKEALSSVDLDQILHSAKEGGCDIGDLSEVEILPATAGQIYMMSMWLNTNGSNFYPEFKYSIAGSVSFEQLQGAWKTLVAANPILRTYFVATQDTTIPYVQLVRNDGKGEDTITNGTGHTEDEIVQSTGQPWVHLRASQVQHGWQLMVKIHHALYDGVSLPLLMQQLQYSCRGNTATTQHGILQNFIGSHSGPTMLEARKRFWIEYLEDFEQSYLPQPTATPGIKTEIFKPGLLPTKSLEEYARKSGVSIQVLFLATFAVVHARLIDTPEGGDTVLGVYLANRSASIAGIEGAAIPTVNLLPLRVHAPLAHDLKHVAQQIQQDLQMIGEPANASASFFEISEWTGVKIDVFVNFLTFPDAGNEDAKTGDDEGVKITAETEWTGEVHRVVDQGKLSSAVDEHQMHCLRNAKVNEAYLHAVDIEATVRNGALDVGVFAPVEMLERWKGTRLIDELGSALKGVGE